MKHANARDREANNATIASHTALGGGEDGIAIVGIGCRFPGGANSPAGFWRLLQDGVDAITEMPAERFDLDRLYDADPSKPGRMYVRWGGFMDQVDGFDAAFFGMRRARPCAWTRSSASCSRLPGRH